MTARRIQSRPNGTSQQKESVPKFKYTSHIRILDYGKDEGGQRFVQLRIRGQDGVKVELLRIDNLTTGLHTLNQLNRVGANLTSTDAKKELVKRIQEKGSSPARLKVATRIGFHWPTEDCVLPDEVISGGKPRVLVKLDDATAIYASKFRVSQETDWREIPELARGNSRLMVALVLALVGPCVLMGDLLQVGLQLVGAPESGKSAIAMAAGSIWGCHVNPERANDHGFGETWNNTAIKFELIAVGHNHSLLIADETRTAATDPKKIGETVLAVLLKMHEATEKGRYFDTEAVRGWWISLLSTSNKSLDELCAQGGITLDDAYRGRLIDIGPPEDGNGFFEDLHGYRTDGALSEALKKLAKSCFGWPSRRFIQKLVQRHATDPSGLKSFFNRKRRLYLGHARKIVAEGRQIDRVHQKMATLYAVGRLAIRFGIFPWTEAELLEAVLKCERDHVTWVAREMAKHGSAMGATGNVVQGSIGRLLSYIRENQHRFIDLRRGARPSQKADPNLGYINEKDGRAEFLFTEPTFERIAGGKAASIELKQDLDQRTLIDKTGAGRQGAKLVVRRQIPSGPRNRLQRQWVVAIFQDILEV